jgi:hypothetical protein
MEECAMRLGHLRLDQAGQGCVSGGGLAYRVVGVDRLRGLEVLSSESRRACRFREVTSEGSE